ncbi:hypothetical protein [Nitratiruptor sp. YY09-18]|uniref:hypothetical protein n=1 Tax=Nitratiruptor sp. YY09-18 TaxID=2724901 RepID=UPI0019155A11|nr:hypothetical protein [Nitratiruptor sp. YY09-18]BCD67243.1 hypothetical protein NitYY0918_C0114 [Nitratiruptor sp. YY09-18]
MRSKKRICQQNDEKGKNTNLHSRGIAALAAAFGVVAFWRGSWMLMDKYLFPNNDLLSALVSIVGGIGIILFLNYKFEDLF